MNHCKTFEFDHFTDRTRCPQLFANIDQSGKQIDLPNLPSKLFWKMKFTQTENGEERTSGNLDEFFGSIWSLRSKISNKSPDTVRKNSIYIFNYYDIL